VNSTTPKDGSGSSAASKAGIDSSTAATACAWKNGKKFHDAATLPRARSSA
jgi:hypothetical protein